MSNVVIRYNAARIISVNIRIGGIAKSVVFKPSENDSLITVPSDIWAEVKKTALIEAKLDSGQLVIKSIKDIEDDSPVVAAEIIDRPGVATKAMNPTAVKSEIEAALESGDIETIKAKFPNFATMIDTLVASAADKLISDIQDDITDDTENDSDPESSEEPKSEPAANIDTLLESLDGKGEDEIKRALRAYSEQKYDMKLGNTGQQRMIEMIKEKESDGE